MEYRSLTEYNKHKNDQARKFIDAQKRLEEIGLVKSLGKINYNIINNINRM